MLLLHIGHTQDQQIMCLYHINPIALRKVKIAYNFGLSECNRVNVYANTIFLPRETTYVTSCLLL